MNSRFLSIITSFHRNGVLRTFNLLLKIALLKTGIKQSINLKKYGNINLRNKTSDLPVFRQVFFDLEYKINFKIKNPKVIIDTGANIGMFTMYLKPTFPEAKYICLEPEPSNFEILQKNLGNSINVDLVQNALWIDDQGVQITIDPKYGEWGATVSNTLETGIKVKSITMDQLLEKYELEEVDILKMDIEGAEKYIFNSNLNWMKKVKIIIIELHDFMDKGSSNSFFRSLETIEPYEFYCSGENIIIKQIEK